MNKIRWNKNWFFCNLLRPDTGREVTLPHDAMQTEKRLPNMKNGAAAGFFPGGRYQYRKRFTAPEDWRDQSVIVEFEGVYQNSSVLCNDVQIGGWVYGYTGFTVDLTEHLRIGEENEIRVIADNSRTPNSRWYTGSGIYRDVNLYVGDKRHIAVDGIKVITESIDPAVLHVTTELENAAGLGVEIIVYDGEKPVARGQSSDCRITIPEVRLWSAETPHLYRVTARLRDGETVIDEQECVTGIRSLAWSAEKGLQVNGETVKLRGGCIHHDNGILGACAPAKVEERKVRILKEAGFNAIRSAHNSCSKALLAACDKLGVYVMDEAFDCWLLMKVDYDYSIYFDDNWEKDLRAMLRKDWSHPSVVMYSIGNEIGDTGKPEGAEISRKLTAVCHELDPSRPVINCINPVVSNMGGKRSKAKPTDSVDPYLETKNSAATASLLANIIVTVVPFIQKLMGKPEKVEKLLKPCFDAVDIVGLNYAEHCYEPHHGCDPKRIMLGSETYPHSMARRWKLVEQHPYVIGDFMWTAMDYLGEAGIGVPIYGSSKGGFNRPYPCVSGGCGAIDLIGHLETEGVAAAIAWGQYNKPYIAVRPVNHSGEKYFFGMWRATDAEHSWSWKGCEGKTAQIEVYSPGASVELLQDGQSLGRKPLLEMKAEYTTAYRPGELRAVSYDENGNTLAEDVLITAGGETVLTVKAYSPVLKADGEDLSFVSVELTDSKGIVKGLEDRAIKVEVTGAGELAAIGSGNPVTEESFTGSSYTSWKGRMGFYVRSKVEPGEIRIRITADGVEPVEQTISVK